MIIKTNLKVKRHLLQTNANSQYKQQQRIVRKMRY